MVLYYETSDCCCSDVRAVEEARAGRAATLWALLLFFFFLLNGTWGQWNGQSGAEFWKLLKLLPFYTVVYSYLQLKVASETWGDVFHLEEIEDSMCLFLSTWAAAKSTEEITFWKNRSDGLVEGIPPYGRWVEPSDL